MMLLKIVRLATMFLLLMYPIFKSFGQEHRFVHIDGRHGLSHGHITAIYRDETGFMWFGTESGLDRFDGYTITVFRNDASDSTSLYHDHIGGLFKMPGGKMGIITGAGPCLYDPVRETFSKSFEAFHAYSIRNPIDLKSVVSDSKGNYWFIIQNDGMICYNEKRGTTIFVKHSDQDTTSIATNNITSIEQHIDGTYWIAHSNGIVENMTLGEQGVRVIKRLNFFYDRRYSKEDYLQCELMLDRDGDIWVYPVNYDMGVAYLNIQQGKINHLGKNSGNPRLSSNMITSLVEDNNGDIWIATGQNGIDVLDKKTLSVINMSHVGENDNTLSHNSITTMLKDNDGVIWVGTYKKGLNYFHENIMRFPLVSRYSKPHGLPYEDINAFVEDANGNLWLGTNGGGLVYFDRQTGKFTSYRHNPKNPKSLSNDVIVSLCLDHKGQLWAGTFLGGLNCFDGREFTRYQHDSANPKSLSGTSVWEILEDSQQRLWIGTLSGGLCLFDQRTKTFTKYYHPDQRSLYSAYLPTIFEDSEGNIWFGTFVGIDVLMKTSGAIVHFENQKNNPSSIGSNDIFAIMEDSNGRIWIGTRGGLSVWQRESNTFINYTEKHGLPHNAILSMLEDENGRLWLGTPNGLSLATISPEKEGLHMSFKNYTEMDGLQGKQFNEGAALKTSKGELIFAGANGFNIFRPRDLSQNKIVPRLVLTDFQLFNRSIHPTLNANGKFTLPASITTNPSIILHAGDNVFSIEFAALGVIQPSKNVYKYKLDGFNNDWLVTDAGNRKVTFTNLDAGDYVFRLTASNNDGIWNEEGISLNIKVLPPFWRSPTAYVMYVLAMVLLLLTIRRVIQERERMKFAIRQTLEEAQRSRELDVLKTKFFTNVSHELRTPLSLILAPIEKLSQKNADSQERKQFDLIQRNARRLLNLVNQLLDFRKLEVNEIRFQPAEGDIIGFIKETVFSFSDLSEKKEIRLAFNSNVSALETIFDHDKLEKILFNLLSNAIKFTLGPGEVSVTVDFQDASENNIVQIKVKDTGIGIPPEKHQLIFERFFQNDLPNTIINQGSGIGLAITKEFVRIHGGSIRVESEVGKGSCFVVVLSLKKIGQPVHEIVHEPVQPVASDSKTEYNSPGKPLILIVEDNEDFRFYLKDNLKLSYSVIEAATGEEGWNKTISQHPDLIVTDITMPGLGGLDFCKMVKSDSRVSGTPVILLTARSEDEQRLEGFEAGADDYIPKPFNFQVLESRIRNLILSRQNLHALFGLKDGIKASEVQVTSLDEQFLHGVVQAIEKHVSNADLTVTDLARELGVSRSQFFKRVQTVTGKSPLEIIRLIRLQHAAQLLEKSQLSVSEIAYKVGFNNPKYFARYFKELYHVLPSAYASGKRSS